MTSVAKFRKYLQMHPCTEILRSKLSFFDNNHTENIIHDKNTSLKNVNLYLSVKQLISTTLFVYFYVLSFPFFVFFFFLFSKY